MEYLLQFAHMSPIRCILYKFWQNDQLNEFESINFDTHYSFVAGYNF